MPGNLSTADTSFPDLNGARDDKEKIEKITAYLALLLEQLRYTLNNLGMDNFNDTELKIMSQTLTEPVEIKLRDIEGNVTTIQLAADELSSTVEALDGDVSTLKQTANSISAEFGSNGRVTRLESNINGLRIRAISSTGYMSGASLSDTSLYFYDGSSSHVTGEGALEYVSGMGNIIGRVDVDNTGSGTDGEAAYRMFVGTGRGRKFDSASGTVNYALKLQSAGDTSYSSKTGGIYIRPGNSKHAWVYDGVNGDDGWYEFKDSGFTHGGVRIGHTEATIKGWIRDAVNTLATKNGLSPISLSGTTFN